MNRSTKLIRIFLGASALLVTLLMGACAGEPDKISEEEFFQYLNSTMISEVTVYKPADANAAAKVEGRFHRIPEGKKSLFFVVEMKVDEDKIAQMKSSGVKPNFKE